MADSSTQRPLVGAGDDGDIAGPAESDRPAEPAEPAESVAADPPSPRSDRQVTVSVRTLLTTAAVGLLVVTVAVLGWLYGGARGELADQERRTADDQRAQQIAMDYAVNAAQMDYRDLTGWKARLVAGTSPELRVKLTDAADSMEQILAPLQWESTAKPLAAIVRSSAAGVFVVDAFVSVLTKTTQSPQGLQSTATYSITINSGADWSITDVGGIDAVVAAR